MKTLIQNYRFHITIGTAVVVILALLGFGLSAGNYKSKVEDHDLTLRIHEAEIKKIPIMQVQIDNIEDNTKDIKNSVNRIENILLKTK